jgi:hypothetical protein
MSEAGGAIADAGDRIMESAAARIWRAFHPDWPVSRRRSVEADKWAGRP